MSIPVVVVNSLTEILSNEERMKTLLRLSWPVSRSADVEVLAPQIGETMLRYNITTPVRAKHFIGQVGHESGQGRYREEIASGAAYENSKMLGNTEPGDGRRFKGRGLIQLTGRANYRSYAKSELPQSLLIDTEQSPELVRTRTDLCCDVAGWYWETRKLNAIADGPTNERDTIELITKKINGGYNGLADRVALTARARVAIQRLI
jgi:putative chitinase